MKEKANTFIETLQTKYKKAKFKIFVDSNTILEKAWAARCGIGWIGKNTLLINKENGSFLFICIVLTDLELNYDEMLEDNCGNCNACIDACPTKAIEAPFHLNASKCIAYHTIENDTSEEKINTKKYGIQKYEAEKCIRSWGWENPSKNTKKRFIIWALSLRETWRNRSA